MNNKNDEASDKYDVIAEEYAEYVDEWPGLIGYERPGTLSLLPDVAGKQVLDAGCGPGWYTEWLVNHDADVVAFDASENMVDQACLRVGDQAAIYEADLSEPLSFVEDESFDIVLSALALDYVKNWENTFKEFYRHMKPGGVFIYSVRHPIRGMEQFELDSYLGLTQVMEPHGKFETSVDIPSYYRSLEAIVNTTLNVGFVLNRLLAPEPTDKLREMDPDDYETLLQRPHFLCIKAKKPPDRCGHSILIDY